MLRQAPRGSDERATNSRLSQALGRSHTLFYRVTGEGTIDVVRVLHQRMDVDPEPLTRSRKNGRPHFPSAGDDPDTIHWR